VVVALVPPRPVERGRDLPVLVDHLVGDPVVPHRAVVPRSAQPAVDQARGLQAVDDVDEPLAPVGRHHPRRVEPDQADRAVAREQFFDLGLGLFAEVPVVGAALVLLLVGTEIPRVACPARLVPVLGLGVVESEPHAAFGAGVGQLLEHVPLERRGVHDVVLAGPRAVHGEAVVVLARDDDVLHPRILGELNPFIRIELHRVEPRGQLLVLCDRDLGPVHDPLPDARNLLALPRPGRDRVQAPVDEQSELRLPEPLHLLVLGHRAGGPDRTGHRAHGGRGCHHAQQAGSPSGPETHHGRSP